MSWQDRFRAPRWETPSPARDAPTRCVLLGNPTGTWEVYSWDGTDHPIQATARPDGTDLAGIDPTGREVWWFADNGGDEFGSWRRQPFGSGPGSDIEALPGVPAGYPAGLEIGAGGIAAVGVSTDDGSALYWMGHGEPPRLLYRHDEDASVEELSRAGDLVVIAHSEHGDSRHPALRAIRPDGALVADLWDGPGLGLEVEDLSPAGDVVLVAHERRGRQELALWTPRTGAVRELSLALDGEISGQFFPDGNALLVVAEFRARSSAWRYDLAAGALTRVSPPDGTVSDAVPRADGTAWLGWSSAAQPPQVLAVPGDRVLLAPAGPLVSPGSVPATDVFVDGPGGLVHALLCTPAGPAPHPTVVDVHGGPTWHDSDSFSPSVAALVDAGYAVVRVNYRGSTGYGSPWRDAIEASPGLVELADIAAVHDRLIATGVVDPHRSVLSGGSWGGFLTLLGLGRQPSRWACGVAAVPVADYVAAYQDEMEALKAFDRSLFGGSPEQVPERYRLASPLTYVQSVAAPVLILAGANDPRCPLRQIENYLAALREREAPHEVYRFDAGHGSLVIEERIRQMSAEIEFIQRQVPTGC